MKTEQGASQLVLLIEFLNKRQVNKLKTIQQRQEYLQAKMKQHNAITDVHKYQNRLKWIMRYHRLLTDLEVKKISENLRKAFK